MTTLLYQTDSYLRQYDTLVTGALTDLNAVALDSTPFYPGGGGQPCDFGTLTYVDSELPVLKVWREGDNVWHQLEGPLPPEGSLVRAQLDWARRYALMRTHTALHILCGVIWRDYHALVTGGNMEPGQGRLDFEFETLHQELVAEIEHKVNAEVRAARDIRVKLLPRKEAFLIPDLIRTKINLLPEGISTVRTVEIVGLDLQADGGTHVANTREVGELHIPGYQSKGRINKRIRLELAG
ncbi:MAG: alanyl-tRNA editing protein [Chloroflexi bacterium]|nr:alanyl-tRNA editing protein [Chloroflexota bacterium]